MAHKQLSLGGEFAWTTDDDQFLASLAPRIKLLVERCARESGLRPIEAWLQLHQGAIRENQEEREINHAP